MYGIQFYPTPENVVLDILGDIKLRGKVATILDPSGGDGALLDYFKEKHGWHRVKTISFEIDPNLQAILTKKGHIVIGSDFLSESCPYSPNLIVMNPPFKDGDKHLLKAWELLKDGEIRCILNAETYNNPYSQTRKELKYIIDTFGEVRNLGQAFKDSRRKTDVNTILVTLRKEAVSSFDFDVDSLKKEKFDFNEAIEEGNELAIQDELSNLELRYNLTIETAKKAIDGIKAIKQVKEKFVSFESHVSSNYYDHFIAACDLNGFIHKLNADSWNNLLYISKFQDQLTSKVKDEFREKFKTQQNVAFTKSNMINLFSMLFDNRGEIQKECLISTFDYLTKYHPENRESLESWKSNEAFIVKKNRFILPNMIEYDLQCYKTRYDSRDKLDDIDKTMNAVTGEKMTNITSIVDTVDEALGEGVFKGESTHFHIKMFKKGTLHFKFKEDYTWRMFNYFASEARGFPIPEPKDIHRPKRLTQ